eukprot:gene9273-10251_t
MHQQGAKIAPFTGPDSWYLPKDGVQRGTVLRMRGDPLSHGYPALASSKFNDVVSFAKRSAKEENRRVEYHAMVAEKVYADRIKDNLKYLTSMPHIAGSPESKKQAEWVAGKFEEAGFDRVEIKKYKVLLSYPTEPGSVKLMNANGDEEVSFLSVEDSYNQYENDSRALPPFIAYSQSGTFEGELVYANFGTEKDYEELVKKKIELKNCIALVRYGKVSRSKKLRAAENHKLKGVIIYSDPDQYAPSGTAYPDSWYLPKDGVQRGTVLRMRGDPLSNGYPALDGFHRWDLNDVTYFPKMPILPIGYGNAEKLLRHLDGDDLPSKTWKGKLQVTYKINSKSKKKVRIKISVNREDRFIYNVVGTLQGKVEPDRLVILGNHRDAWVYGAADPSSGTAVMVELARSFGWLKEKGWKPRRTILLCSWDAEEFGLIGSTEWVEDHSKLLSQRAVAYLNIDTAVEGNFTIELKSTPHLRDTFYDIVKMFKDPDDKDSNLFDTWVKKRGNVNIYEPEATMFKQGSDYMSFFGDLGIPSMDFRYTFNAKTTGVFKYPVYHSIHDNFDWMKRFVDPDFRYHETIAKLWLQLALTMADSIILPFNIRRYGENLMKQGEEIEKMKKDVDKAKNFDVGFMKDACKQFKKATLDFHRRLQSIDKEDALAVRMANDKLMLFERSFVLSEDIPGEYTRHLYHSSGVKSALDAVVKEKPGSLDDLKIKITAFTYHVRMATMSLQNFFVEKKCSENCNIV